MSQKQKKGETPEVIKEWTHKTFKCPSCSASAVIEVERLQQTNSSCRFCNRQMEEVNKING
jgi:transcription elongation factor Elf1